MNTKHMQVVTTMFALASAAAVRADTTGTIEYSNVAQSTSTVASSQIVASQNVTWKDVFSQSGIVPLTMKAGLLDSSWRSFKANNGDWAEATLSVYTGGPSAYYTQGQELQVNGESYLVAYREERPTPSLGSVISPYSGGDAQKQPAFTGNTTLLLALLNLRTIGNLTEIKPFNKALFNKALFKTTRASETPEEKEDRRMASSIKLSELGMGVRQYIMRHNGKLPPMQSRAAFEKAMDPYLKKDDALIQPGIQKPYVVNSTLSGKNVAKIAQQRNTAAVYEAEMDSDGKRGVTFLTGETVRVTAADWTRIKRVSNIK